MSTIYKKKYGSFQRNILAEYLSEKELIKLDKIYSLAKVKRSWKREILKINLAK